MNEVLTKHVEDSSDAFDEEDELYEDEEPSAMHLQEADLTDSSGKPISQQSMTDLLIDTEVMLLKGRNQLILLRQSDMQLTLREESLFPTMTTPS